MTTPPAEAVLHHVRALAARHPDSGPDAQLLERFAASRDEAAFEALVRRHGPMVLGVCRRVLRHEQDAEDAFQATFLVLARRAHAVRKGQALAAWLHGVARRLSLKARARAARRSTLTPNTITEPAPDAPDELTWGEVRAALDEELARLCEKYRTPLVLCYLEGLARDEAAARVGCPLGTLKGRLERGRELLRRRLTRRGLALSAALAAVALDRAVVPAALAAATARAASAFVTGPSDVSAASALADVALHELTQTKLRAVAALLLGLTLLVGGTGLLVQRRSSAVAPTVEAEPHQTDKAADVPSAKVDAQGDPLPPGALVRLGTIRYRFANVGAAFLPDGKTVVSVEQDRAIKLWDARTGRLVREIDTSPFFIGTARGFALSADGQRLAVNGWIHEGRPGSHSAARVFDLATGKDLQTVERPARDGVNALTLTPDGKLLFTFDRNGQLRIAEVSTGTELLRQQFPGDVMAALAISPDGATVAVGSGPNTRKIFVWRWQAGEKPREIKVPDEHRGRDLAFSPDGRLLADCSDAEPDVRVWDVGNGRMLHRLELPDHEPYGHYHVAFSPDGKFLAAWGGTGRRDAVHLWDPSTGQFVRGLDIGGVLAFSPDSKLLVAGSRVWDFAAGKELSANDAAHRDAVHEVVAAGKDVVVTAGGDNTVRFWDAASGKHLRRLALDGWAGGIALSHDGRLLVTGSGDEICLWDVASARRIYRLAGHGQQGSVLRSVVFTADDRSFLSWGPDMNVRRWDVRTGKATAEQAIRPPGVRVPSEDDEPIDRDRELLRLTLSGGQFTPDGRYLILQVGEKWYVFETATGKELRSFPSEGRLARGVAISPDGKLLVATGHGTAVQVKRPDGTRGFLPAEGHPVTCWDLTTGEQRKQITLPEEAPGPVAFSLDGARIAVASSRPGARIRILDVTTGRELRKIEGMHGVVRSLAFMPDGKRLVSGMEDSSALIWDLAR
jgi:RNA polymerase sigma factor (sigma-70 family)